MCDSLEGLKGERGGYARPTVDTTGFLLRERKKGDAS